MLLAHYIHANNDYKHDSRVTATGLEPTTVDIKWLSVRLGTKWLWVRVQLQSLKLKILRLLPARSPVRVWINSETRTLQAKNIQS